MENVYYNSFWRESFAKIVLFAIQTTFEATKTKYVKKKHIHERVLGNLSIGCISFLSSGYCVLKHKT